MGKTQPLGQPSTRLVGQSLREGQGLVQHILPVGTQGYPLACQEQGKECWNMQSALREAFRPMMMMHVLLSHTFVNYLNPI